MRSCAGLLLCLTVLLIVAPSPGAAGSLDDLFQRANATYEEEQFAAAARQYEQLIRTGADSAEVYHNFATALLAAGDRGGALLNYERALRRDPRNPAVRSALRDIDIPDAALRADAPWSLLTRFVRIEEWTAGFLVAFALFGILGSLRLAGVTAGTPAGRMPVLTAVGLAALLCAAGIGAHAADEHLRPIGIAVVDEAVCRAGPSNRFAETRRLAFGSQVVLRPHTVEGWVRLLLPNGEEAFARTAEVQPLAVTR